MTEPKRNLKEKNKKTKQNKTKQNKTKQKKKKTPGGAYGIFLWSGRKLICVQCLSLYFMHELHAVKGIVKIILFVKIHAKLRLRH